jgi:hypothetical protein
MIVKIYGAMWALGLLAAGILYLTGNLTPVMEVVFGFLTFGALFMGLIAVLPVVEFHDNSHKH